MHPILSVVIAVVMVIEFFDGIEEKSEIVHVRGFILFDSSSLLVVLVVVAGLFLTMMMMMIL